MIRTASGFDFLSNPVGSTKKALFNLPNDPSAIIIVLSNILFIIVAVLQNVSLQEVWIVYWCQSIIIGFFAVFRMLTYKLNPHPAVKVILAESPMPKKGLVEMGMQTTARIFTAGFFIFHYGFFHVVYLVFIGFSFISSSFMGVFTAPGSFVDAAGAAQLPGPNILLIFLGALIFFIAHLISFILNFAKDNQKSWDLGELMFAPYSRIVPMHISIIAGGFIVMFLGVPMTMMFGSGGSRAVEVLIIVFFLGLKVVLDLTSHDSAHSSEHNI